MKIIKIWEQKKVSYLVFTIIKQNSINCIKIVQVQFILILNCLLLKLQSIMIGFYFDLWVYQNKICIHI